MLLGRHSQFRFVKSQCYGVAVNAKIELETKWDRPLLINLLTFMDFYLYQKETQSL